MSLRDKAVSLLKNSSLMPLYDAVGGLSEFYALVFAATGIVLAFRGKLDANFAGMIVAVQGLLVAHDALDDYHARKRRDGQQQ